MKIGLIMHIILEKESVHIKGPRRFAVENPEIIISGLDPMMIFEGRPTSESIGLPYYTQDEVRDVIYPPTTLLGVGR
jgi:hypothetical protein